MNRRHTSTAALLLTLALGAATSARASGLDTPPGVTNLPFNVEGNQIMNMTHTGLGIGIGSAFPANTLDVGGSAAIGSYASAVPAPDNDLIVSGAVGVGTTVPQAPVDVDGGVRGTNAAIVAGNACSPEGMLGYDLHNRQPVYCGPNSSNVLVWTSNKTPTWVDAWISVPDSTTATTVDLLNYVPAGTIAVELTALASSVDGVPIGCNGWSGTATGIGTCNPVEGESVWGWQSRVVSAGTHTIQASMSGASQVVISGYLQ